MQITAQQHTFVNPFALLDSVSKIIAAAQHRHQDVAGPVRRRWLPLFFGELATFRPHLQDPFANDYYLNHLTSAEAESVVTKPAARFGFTFDPDLVK